MTMSFRNRWIRMLCVAGVALACTALPATRAIASGASGSASQPTSATAAPSQNSRVDINRATEKELTAVPGIGVIYAERIIANRPYHSKYDLVTRGILSRNVYNQIKDRIVAHRVKK